LLALGEKEAYYLGMNVQLVKKLLVALVAITVGAAVANCGIIAFMGLLVPHIIRISVGHNFKLLMPLSVMFGGILLLIADTTARTIIAPSELPIGIITTGIGGPFFIWLLLRDRKKETI
jgi:iron complex transport system permease protein